MSNNQSPNVGTGLGISALVLGIVALPLALMPCTFIGGLVLGVLGVALSAVGYTQAKKVAAPTTLLVAALVISIISTCFAAVQFSNSVLKVKNLPWNKIERNIDRLEDNAEEFGKIFEEELEKEFGGELEDVLKELEEELEDVGKNIERYEDNLEHKIDSLSDEEVARKLGKAAGRALRGLVDELNDSLDSDK